jgi:SAM-dependent methyltransferase
LIRGDRTVNQFHLDYCASPEWRQTLEEVILPEALRGVDLGPNVIEIGPGPGLTTDVLKKMTDRLTCVELDPDLAASLAERTHGSNVRVVCSDASSLEFPDRSFSGAASFHMLHHIETDETQNRVFAELARVLAPSGVLVAADGTYSEESEAFHADDVYNTIDPGELEPRLTNAGFRSVDVRVYDLGWVCTAVV